MTETTNKTTKIELPGSKELADIPDHERAAIQRQKDRHESLKDILFKDGLPTPRKGQHGTVPFVALIDIVKAREPNAALQTVYNAAAGKHWMSTKDVRLTAALSQIVDLDPQTPLEAMLISQMVAVNAAVGQCMDVAMIDDQYPESRQRNIANATKLQRTFLLQIEALQKLRGKGQQTVRVEHVTVNAGGQAIVGHVKHTNGGGCDGE